MNKTNILITGAGGPAAISFYKGLIQKENHNIYMADMDKYSSGLYLVAEKNRVLIPPGRAHNFITELLKICKKRNVNILVPTVDWELLPIAAHISQFRKMGIKVILSKKRGIECCLDKFKLMQRLSSKFLLATFKKYDADFNMQNFVYPVLAKPRCESGSRGVKIIHSIEDFNDIPMNGSYLIQQYLPGEEFSVDVYLNKKHKSVASVVRQRIKIDSGLATISKTIGYPDLSIQAARMAEHLKLRYAVNVQFKLNQLGYPCLLEINPRFPGTMPLTVAAGVNMPQMSIDEVLGGEIEANYPSKHIAMVRYWQEKYLDTDAFNDSKFKS